MSDTAPSTKAVLSNTWADVAMTALHYTAAAALIGLVAYMVSIDKLHAELLVVLITGAAAAIGIVAKSTST